MDTHPGINEETLLSTAISDCLVMVMRPDQQDYLGTAVAIEVAQRLMVPEASRAMPTSVITLVAATEVRTPSTGAISRPSR